MLGRQLSSSCLHLEIYLDFVLWVQMDTLEVSDREAGMDGEADDPETGES